MASFISDIMNEIDGGASRNAQDLSKNVLNQAHGMSLPILKEYYPELYKQVVQMNPELETAVTLGPSEMQGISTDPALRQAQMKALLKLQEIGDADGMDFQSQADLLNVQNEVNSVNRGNQDAIIQNMATRGQSGGGQEMVARSIAAQEASNRGSQMAMEARAQAQQRALQALMQSGQVAGQMEGQDFQRASSKAQAADAINKFNAQNTQQVMSNNVNTKNQAQQLNASNTQDVANKNTGLKNDAQLYNSDLAQKEYENKLKKLGIVSGASQNVAGSYQNESNANRQFLGGLVGAGAQYYGGKK